jgi:MerR family transcriptional regulator, light-induced transcriptional regulator
MPSSRATRPSDLRGANLYGITRVTPTQAGLPLDMWTRRLLGSLSEPTIVLAAHLRLGVRMRSLKTREAAALLNVSTNTLRMWEQKFGFPKPLRSPGRHRTYTYGEIVALRDALRRGLSVPSAISAVCEGLGADTETLVNALEAFNVSAADRAMEASLALRSMERSVDEVLLPALDAIRRRDGVTSTKWALAHQWGIGWLTRAQRLLIPADSGIAILMGDASGGAMDAAGPRIHALELFCRRDGLEVMLLPVQALGALDEAIAIVEPACVVVAGSHASDEQVARWIYAVRGIAGALPLALYLRPTRATRSAHAAQALAVRPIEAHGEVAELVAVGCRAKHADSAPETNRFAHSS